MQATVEQLDPETAQRAIHAHAWKVFGDDTFADAAFDAFAARCRVGYREGRWGLEYSVVGPDGSRSEWEPVP